MSWIHQLSITQQATTIKPLSRGFFIAYNLSMDPTIYSPIRIVMPDGAPRIIRKEQIPDARQIVILPLRAAKDQRLTIGQMRVLIVTCSYANRAGLLWAGQKRIGQDLGLTQQSISAYMKKLERMGYIETVKKGFNGERANTRRIIFNEALTLREVMKISEDPAPYMVEQKIKRKPGRPKRVRPEAAADSQSIDNCNGAVESIDKYNDERLGELASKVSSKIWQLAITRAGNDQSFANIKSIINKLLR